MPDAPVNTIHDVFASRWVDLPDGVAPLDPNTLATGFKAGGGACGIKKSGKPDLGLLVNTGPAFAAAARFTLSSAPAAPVQVCRQHADIDDLRAAIVNSGNANAATGGRGFDNAVFMQGVAAMATGVGERQVAVASTGVIGEQLDTALIAKGAAEVAGRMSERGALDFAAAIMTTDAFAKLAAVEVQLSGGPVRISAQVKGAGMIAPAHAPPQATLLGFVQTDAVLDAQSCDRLLGAAIAGSFDCVTVDAQLSTNDSIFLMASGASGVAPAGDLDTKRLEHAFDALLKAMAISLIRDGEGAKRIAKVTVIGGDRLTAERVARAVADSPLVKTALHGGDANWGRIIQAVGMALGTGEEVPVDIEIEGIEVCKSSAATRFDADDLAKRVQREEVEYLISLPGGTADAGASAEVYFSDLSHEYVTINADYRT